MIWLVVGIAIAVVAAGALIMFLVPELSTPGDWVGDADDSADREQCMTDVRFWCQRNQDGDWSTEFDECTEHSDYISDGTTNCADVLDDDSST